MLFLSTGLAALAANGETIVLRDGASPTAAYSGTRDARIYDGAGTYWATGANYSTGDLSATGGSSRTASLIRWDVSLIPANSTVTGATIYMRATNSGSGYEIYQCLRSWVESQVTWNSYATGSAWATAGALATSDRGTTSLGSASGTSGSTATLTLNASGVSVVNGWVRGTTPNQGIIIQDYANTSGVGWSGSEASTAGDRPRLRVVYNAGTIDFQNGVSPSTVYAGTTDAVIASAPDPSTQNCNGCGLQVSANYSSLLLFDVSPIAPETVVESAALELQITNPGDAYPIFEALRPWTESGATWRRYDGTNNWALAGARDAGADRGDALLGTVRGDAGLATVELTPEGVQLVQLWIRREAPNRGMVIQYGSGGYASFSDSEDVNLAARPALVVRYTIGGLLDGGGPGFVSTPQTAARCDEPYQYASSGGPVLTGPGPWTFSATEAPAGASVDPASGEVSWTPTADQAGPQTFELSATDGTDTFTQRFDVEVLCGGGEYRVGCGCGAGGPGLALGALALAVAVRRRRKKEARATRPAPRC